MMMTFLSQLLHTYLTMMMTFLAQLFANEGNVALGLVVDAGDTLREVESAEERLYDLPAPRCVPQPCNNNKRVFLRIQKSTRNFNIAEKFLQTFIKFIFEISNYLLLTQRSFTAIIFLK